MRLYTGRRDPAEKLPWDMVDMGFDTSFLLKEREKAETGDMTVDCLTGCAACGLGCTGMRNGLRQCESVTAPSGISIESGGTAEHAVDLPEGAKKVTFRYGKYGDARYIGHLDTMNILVRAMKASGVRIRTRGKYHPLPKIALTDALPVGVESFCELIEIETDSSMTVDARRVQNFNERLPSGIRIYEFMEGSLKDMVKDYLFILISDAPPEGEPVVWKGTAGRYLSLWRGKGVKQLWTEGGYTRIIKVESRRIHGI